MLYFINSGVAKILRVLLWQSLEQEYNKSMNHLYTIYYVERTAGYFQNMNG